MLHSATATARVHPLFSPAAKEAAVETQQLSVQVSEGVTALLPAHSRRVSAQYHAYNLTYMEQFLVVCIQSVSFYQMGLVRERVDTSSILQQACVA